jgi:predicted deacylase
LPSGNKLSYCFPGDENGTFGERIAHLFTSEVLRKADFCIELQTGDVNHNILPQVYCNFDNKVSKKLSLSFQTPVVTNIPLKGNKLSQTTEELQIPFLVYQAGEAMRFDEVSISLGVEGVKNIMGHIGMTDNKEIYDMRPLFSRDEEWIVANKSGILHYNVVLGQTIKKNELIATIDDPLGEDVLEPVKAQQEGIIVGINTSPLIHEGLPIFKIASFLDYEKAETLIKEWSQKQTEADSV